LIDAMVAGCDPAKSASSYCSSLSASDRVRAEPVSGSFTGLSPQQLDRVRAAGSGGDVDGIWETGIYGTITGFGSLCINGVRVLLPEAAQLEREGERVDPKELRVGHVVSVEVADHGGTLSALRVSLRSAIEGPVTNVDPAEMWLEVMGQRVELIPDAVVEDEGWGEEVELESIRGGDFVVIHGLRDSEGGVLASYIGRRDTPGAASVRGLVEPGSQPMSIGGVPFSSPVGSEPLSGQWVIATGRWNPESKLLEDIRLEASPPLASGMRRVSVEALIRETDAGNELFAAGLQIETSSFARWIIEELPVNTRVWLWGRPLSDTRIDVIEFHLAEDPLPSPFASNAAQRVQLDDKGHLAPSASPPELRSWAAPRFRRNLGHWAGSSSRAVPQGVILRR
jgi:hypothetical protein